MGLQRGRGAPAPALWALFSGARALAAGKEGERRRIGEGGGVREREDGQDRGRRAREGSRVREWGREGRGCAGDPGERVQRAGEGGKEGWGGREKGTGGVGKQR